MIWKKCLALILGITLLLLPLLFCQGVASSRAGIDILGFSTNSIFYNSSEVGSFQYSLWNDVSPPIYADITIYGEFHGNGTKYILDRRYNVYIEYSYQGLGNFTVPTRPSNLRYNPEDSQHMDIVLEVNDRTNGIVYTSRLRHHVDWVYVEPQQQQTSYSCGAATALMMIHHITGVLYSENDILQGSDSALYMYQYRSRANQLISGSAGKGNPYTSVCHSKNDTYSAFRSACLGPDMRSRSYHHDSRISGHLHGPIVRTNHLPYYYGVRHTHYVLVVGYDLSGNVYIIDPHTDSSYYGYRRIPESSLIKSMTDNAQSAGWVLQRKSTGLCNPSCYPE